MNSFKLVLLVLIVVILAVTAAGQTHSDTKTSAATGVEAVIAESGIEAAVTKFDEMRADTARFAFDEGEFNQLGYRLIREARIEEAVAVMKMMTAMFPDSWNAWDSQGEAYRYAGDKEHAIASYEKSLELNPDNESATWKLSMMDGRIEDHRRETREARRHSPGEQTDIKGPYLGQTPPGTTPEVFAPGIVSCRGDFEFAITFTPDGKEFYYSSHTGLRVCLLEEDGWIAPEHAPFASEHRGAFEPHITADGSKMFFGNGPEIWVMDRTPEGDWGDARRHGDGMFVTTTSDGTLYVTDLTGADFGRIVRQSLVDGEYGEPEPIGGGVADSVGAAHPCIFPDEQIIVFDSWRTGTLGQADLFMCVRRDDGSWSDAIHLPAGINTVGENIAATLSPGGKYMFFTTNNDIYWVSTDALKELVPEED
jgi:hypothetical protein